MTEDERLAMLAKLKKAKRELGFAIYSMQNGMRYPVPEDIKQINETTAQLNHVLAVLQELKRLFTE